MFDPRGTKVSKQLGHMFARESMACLDLHQQALVDKEVGKILGMRRAAESAGFMAGKSNFAFGNSTGETDRHGAYGRHADPHPLSTSCAFLRPKGLFSVSGSRTFFANSPIAARRVWQANG